MKQLRNIIVLVLFTCSIVASPIGKAAEILHTDIVGLQGAELKNVQDRLLIAQNEYGPKLTAAAIERFYKHAPKNIKTAIEPYGYFKAEVYSSLTHRGDQWTARFVVEPGPAMRISHVDVQIHGPGEDNAVLQKALLTFPIKAGQVFQAAKYEEAKQSLFQVANEQGYLKAVFETKTVKVNMANYNAVVIVHLETGPRFYFGRITFQQNTFSEAFLKRFLSFKPGEPFSSPKLVKFQQNLSSSNYFQEINVTPQLQDTADNQVPVVVGLTPTKSRQYNIGIGYGTFTGVRASLGANFRHLTKNGHRLDLQLKASEILKGLAAQYVIPGTNPLTDQYTIGANIQRFTPKNANSDSRSLSFGYTKTTGDWKWSPSITYLREIFNKVGMTSHTSRVIYPGFNVTHTHADDLIETHRGSKIDFTLRGASTALVSNVSFLQADLKAKYIFSPTQYSRVLVRGEFGYTTVRDLNLLPVSLQFYAGGMDSVRGFPFSYFGPGRYLKTGSIELQHRIWGKLSGAIFYDVGTADNQLNAAMGRGKGIGLIYLTPIGAAKAYFGFGNLQGKSRHTDFEFSLGPDL
jgi:translocation and assembly module TamA